MVTFLSRANPHFFAILRAAPAKKNDFR